MKIVMKKAEARMLVLVVVGLIFVSLALFGVTFISSDVTGQNSASNQSVFTMVNISNAKPLLNVLIVEDSTTAPADQIDLTSNGTTTVVCNATIRDFNGWEDIATGNISAIFYRNLTGTVFADAVNDDNSRYENSSCNVSCRQIDAENASCDCSFAVQYFAYNGSWTCNMTVQDNGSTSLPLIILNTSSVDETQVQTLVGIATDGTLDFGDVAATQTSPDKTLNLSNTGNVVTNYSMQIYGWNNLTDYPNLSMVCTLGDRNISSTEMRYSNQSGDAFGDMQTLNSTPLPIKGIVAHPREDDTLTNLGNETNATYWKLRVPLTVGGTCNGTLIVNAFEWVDYAGE